jgi:hypothetical protein
MVSELQGVFIVSKRNLSSQIYYDFSKINISMGYRISYLKNVHILLATAK